MYPSSQAIIYVIAFLSAYVPVLVTGKPQIQLGGIWIGKVPESPKDDAPSQPPTSVSTSEGGLKVISEKPAFTGYIQVFLRKANSDDDGSKLVKIHDSNSTFTIPESISASVKNPARSRTDRTPCADGKLLYEETGKCYQPGPVTPGTDSPCANEFMQFVRLSDKPGYGECFCVTFKGISTRPVVYSEKSNRCHWLYDQGPCEKGQWLVFTNQTSSSLTRTVMCAARNCPENEKEEKDAILPEFWFLHRGKCLQTGTSNSEFCGEAEKLKIYFSNEIPEPVCANTPPLPVGVKGLGSGAGFLSCKAGYKHLPNGECKRTAKFD